MMIRFTDCFEITKNKNMIVCSKSADIKINLTKKRTIYKLKFVKCSTHYSYRVKTFIFHFFYRKIFSTKIKKKKNESWFSSNFAAKETINTS